DIEEVPEVSAGHQIVGRSRIILAGVNLLDRTEKSHHPDPVAGVVGKIEDEPVAMWTMSEHGSEQRGFLDSDRLVQEPVSSHIQFALAVDVDLLQRVDLVISVNSEAPCSIGQPGGKDPRSCQRMADDRRA